MEILNQNYKSAGSLTRSVRELGRFFIVFVLTFLILAQSVKAQSTPAAIFPNDPDYQKNWFVNSLKLNQVWGYGQGEGVVVAVIDTGIDTDHPDLVNQLWTNPRENPGDNFDNDINGYVDDIHGWDFVAYDNTLDPSADKSCFDAGVCSEESYHHGTITSGLIGAEMNNAFGIVGIAPKAKIMHLRALGSNGEGLAEHVTKAIRYAILNGAHIINMSFAGPIEDGNMTLAIQDAMNAGIAVIVASGNSYDDKVAINLDVEPYHPTCSLSIKDRVVGVGAHDPSFTMPIFSNRGSCVDILAPGVGINSLIVYEPNLGFNKYIGENFRGTSVASPIFAGALAVLKSYRPDLNMSQLTQALLDHGQNIDGRNQDALGTYGRGALNIIDTLSALQMQSVVPVVPEIQTPPTTEAPKYYADPNGLAGKVVRSKSISTVYYIANNGGRYYFPNEATYKSWYSDFSFVQVIEDSTLAKYPLAGLVTMRPGTALVKIRTTPQVYAISGNSLRWLSDESIAIGLYGSSWQSLIRDVDDSLFISYKLGEDITSTSQYDVAVETLKARSINELLGL